jgi:capsular exopolysaccharide synthesis family protein
MVGITSCAAGAGVSTVAANLAKVAALQSLGRQVLLVDANLRRPRLHRDFKLDPSPGLVDLLLRRHDLKEVVQPSPLSDLWLMPAGESKSGANLVPDFSGLSEAAADLRAQYDLVVIDLPPASQPGLALPLAALVDGVLVVIESERTEHEAAQRTKRLLMQSQARLIGVVLNKRRDYLPRWLSRML